MLELLGWPTALKSFYYDLGQYADSQYIDSLPLSTLLAPRANTLVRLNIKGYLKTGLHLDKIDFSSFSLLRSLSITQAFLFPTMFSDDGDTS